MSGKAEKARRRDDGISVAARRDQRAFDRLVEQTIDRLEVRRFVARIDQQNRRRIRSRRIKIALAAIGLAAVFTGLILAVIG